MEDKIKVKILMRVPLKKRLQNFLIMIIHIMTFLIINLILTKKQRKVRKNSMIC